MKKLTVWALVLCMLMGLLTVAAAEDAQNIVILYTNDVHCSVDTTNGIGYTGVAALKQQLIKEGNAVALVDNGDAIQGEAIGTLSNGAYIVELMNETGYDLAIPGNHEFDYGMQNFLDLAKQAKYTYLSCNFTDLTSSETVFAPYKVLEMGDKRVAFVGISTPKTIVSSTPTNFMNENGEYIYGFAQDESGEALYACVQAAVDAARAENADYVIALAHLGIVAETSPWMSTEVITHTSGIDAVLDGHSHSTIEGDWVKNKNGENVLLTSTGTKLSKVGKLTIAPDGALTSTLVSYTDEAVSDKVSEITAQFVEVLGQVVAKTDVPLVINDPEATLDGNPVRLIRNTETNLGDLCADAYRYVTNADVALVNGGGIRSDIAQGDITYNDIINVHPYGNELCVAKVTGQQILDALEMGARVAPEENGGFMQVSGLTYEIHTYVPSSVKVDENRMFQGVEGEYRVKNVLVAEQPLELDRVYTLASHNYMLKSAGDGMSMFKGCELVQEDVMLDNQVLITYITEGLGGVVTESYADVYGQGRIVAVPEAK